MELLIKLLEKFALRAATDTEKAANEIPLERAAYTMQHYVDKEVKFTMEFNIHTSNMRSYWAFWLGRAHDHLKEHLG